MPFVPREGPDLTFIGFMILAVFGSLVWNTTPLQSPRPHTNEPDRSKAEIADYVEARLWQDPFYNDPGTKGEGIAAAPCTYPPSAGETSLKVITPMVKVASDKDSVERRIRRRYALIAGLSESGYVPEDPGKIFRCSISIENPDKREGRSPSVSTEVRWERYRHESSSNLSDVIVAWVDNSFFTTDFKNRSNNIATIFPATKIDLIVLGPSDSDSLKKVVKELNNSKEEGGWKPKGVNEFYIYSPFATANDIAEVNEKQKPHFLRTIGKDKKLAGMLHKELQARNINQLSQIAIITERDTYYGRELPKNLCSEFSKGRSCEPPNLFYFLRGIDALNQPKKVSTSSSGGASASLARGNLGEVRQFNPPIGPEQYDYLRRLASQIKHLHQQTKGGLKAIGIFGSDIYDKLLVLRAMRSEFPGVLFFTTDLDAQMIHPQHWRWTRNLIVASNFDLSLHKCFQDSFPPFRDAYQTSFYLSTLMAVDNSRIRYLAEHGEINRKNDGVCLDPLPYETPVDYKKMEEMVRQIEPLVFEIGRYGAIRLSEKIYTSESQNSTPSGAEGDIQQGKTTVHPENASQKNYQSILISIAVLMILSLVILHQIRANSGVLIVVLSGGLVLSMGLVYLVAQMSDVEPFSFTEGVSVWPTIFIRFIAFLLALAFILKSICDLEKNFGRLSRDYFGVDRGGRNHRFPTLCNPSKPKSCHEIFNFEYLVGVFRNAGCHLLENISLYASAVSFVVLGIVISIVSRIYEFSILEIALAWGGLLTLCLMSNAFVCKVESINNWMSKPMEHPTIDGLWDDYHAHGRLPQRLVRAVSMWVMFMSIAAILFYLMPTWPSPARGESVLNVDRLVLMLSVLFMMLLTFIALDAQRLCIYWMRKLRKELLVEGVFTLKVEEGQLAAQNSLVRLRRVVELVSERTNEVDRLIYYPLIIVILMIFARNNYFDNWGFPQAIGIVICINIAMIVGAGLKLRREAKKVKAAAMERAKKLQPSDDSVQDYSEDRISAAIKEINDTQGGAFLPMRSQPVIRALFLVAGSIGLTVGEYITLFGR